MAHFFIIIFCPNGSVDLSKYGIDLVGEDGKLYLPLTTLSDLFSATYLAAEYVGGNLYFLKTMMESQDEDGYFDRTPIFQQTKAFAGNGRLYIK